MVIGADMIVLFVVLLVLVTTPVLIVLWYWLSSRSEREQDWVDATGVSVVEQETHGIGHGQGLLVENPEVVRVDLGEFGFGQVGARVAFYRLRIHLAFNSRLCFEMTGKFSQGQGKVFEKGEGQIDIVDVDRRFWTETPTPSEVAEVFRGSSLRRALENTSWLYSLWVMGNRIELVFKHDPALLEPMYALGQTLVDVLLKIRSA